MRQIVTIYANGACFTTPGPGGWAAVILRPGGSSQELCGGFSHTTNNRMEITSLIQALSSLDAETTVEFYSRSKYLCDAISKNWLGSWLKRGWKTADKKDVKNRDLWEQLLPLLNRHDVHVSWIQSHSEPAESIRCAHLAQRKATEKNLPRDTGYEGSAAENRSGKLPEPTAVHTSASPAIKIYTDGSCLGNPGAGGWAALISRENDEPPLELSGGFRRTTNNRMEILSVIEALKALKNPSTVDLYSDSQYVCNAVSKGWISSWVKKTWCTAKREPVKNQDLWEALLPELKRHKVTFHWIEGHAGHPENERCDVLARSQASKSGLPVDPGF